MKLVPKRSKQFEVLRRMFLFDHVKMEVAESVFQSPICECFEFEQDEFIYTRNNFRRCMGLVVSGKVRAVKHAQEGDPALSGGYVSAGSFSGEVRTVKHSQEGGIILLNTFSSGGVFGVAGLFQNSSEYVSDVQAIRRSRVLFLPEELLRSLFRREPMTAENYIAYLTTRICFLNNRIDIFTGGSAEQRLAGFLLSVCPKESPHIYHLPFTYLELAETLNIGRASLYRAMDSLQQYGVLQRNGRDLSILDPDVLRRIVSSAEQYAEQCLAAFLLSVCPEETPHVYHLPFTYLELSKNLNIGRASLYRAMNSLQRCGVLQRDGHDLFILDPDVLRRMVSHTELDSVRHVLREQRIDKSSKDSQE